MKNYDQMTAQSIAMLDAFAKALAMATIRGDITKEAGSHICQEAEAIFDRWDPAETDEDARKKAEATTALGAVLDEARNAGISVAVVRIPSGEGLGSQQED